MTYPYPRQGTSGAQDYVSGIHHPRAAQASTAAPQQYTPNPYPQQSQPQQSQPQQHPQLQLEYGQQHQLPYQQPPYGQPYQQPQHQQPLQPAPYAPGGFSQPPNPYGGYTQQAPSQGYPPAAQGYAPQQSLLPASNAPTYQQPALGYQPGFAQQQPYAPQQQPQFSQQPQQQYGQQPFMQQPQQYAQQPFVQQPQQQYPQQPQPFVQQPQQYPPQPQPQQQYAPQPQPSVQQPQQQQPQPFVQQQSELAPQSTSNPIPSMSHLHIEEKEHRPTEQPPQQPQHPNESSPKSSASTDDDSQEPDILLHYVEDMISELKVYKQYPKYMPRLPPASRSKELRESHHRQKFDELMAEFNKIRTARMASKQPAATSQQAPATSQQAPASSKQAPATSAPSDHKEVTEKAKQHSSQPQSTPPVEQPWNLVKKQQKSTTISKSKFDSIRDQLAAGRPLKDVKSSKYTPNPAGSKRPFPGKCPFKAFERPREVVEGDFTHGRRADGTLNAREGLPMGVLHPNNFKLNHDEDPKACYVTYRTEGTCKHGKNCPNNHRLKQGQLQWAVNYRNLPIAEANAYIYFSSCNPPEDLLPLEEITNNTAIVVGDMSQFEVDKFLEDLQKQSTRAQARTQRPPHPDREVNAEWLEKVRANDAKTNAEKAAAAEAAKNDLEAQGGDSKVNQNTFQETQNIKGQPPTTSASAAPAPSASAAPAPSASAAPAPSASAAPAPSSSAAPAPSSGPASPRPSNDPLPQGPPNAQGGNANMSAFLNAGKD